MIVCHSNGTLRYLCVLLIGMMPFFAPQASVADLSSVNWSSLDATDLGAPGDGVGLSFAIGPGNIPSFSYYNLTTSKFYFAQYRSHTLSTEVVSNLLSPPLATNAKGLTIAPSTALVFVNDTPHILFETPGVGLQHATRVNGIWVKDSVDLSVAGAGVISATNCASEICVSYYNAAAGNLKFARGHTQYWVSQILDQSADVGAMSNITTDAQGRIYIAYFDATNKTPKLASSLLSGSWAIESLSFIDRQWGIYPSLLVADDGTIHLTASHFSNDNTKFDRAVYYAKKKVGQNWIIAEVGRNYVGSSTQIALDSNQYPQIVSRYLRKNAISGDAGGVYFAQLSQSGQWMEDSISGSLPMDLGNYLVSNISLHRNPWGDLVLGFGFEERLAGSDASRRQFRLQFPPDDDDDGIPNAHEGLYGTSPTLADTDGDGILDGDEVLIFGTDPLSGQAATTTTTTTSTTTTAAPPTTTLTTTSTTTVSATISTTTTGQSTTTTISSTTTTTSPRSLANSIRVNSGGALYFDSQAQPWLADTYFSGGSSRQISASVSGTSNPNLFKSERQGPSFAYHLPVQNGNYRISLYLAETRYSSKQRRVLSVFAEDALLIDNLDLYFQAGYRKAFNFQGFVSVADNSLDLFFEGIKNEAQVCAIAVEQLSDVELRINAGGKAFLDKLSHSWSADNYYQGGKASNSSTNILATDDDTLYQSSRQGKQFTYSIPLPEGYYELLLYFTELRWRSPGQRVFDVIAEDSIVADNMDIINAVGKQTPLMIPVYLQLHDTTLNLLFSATTDNALLSGIEIRKMDPQEWASARDRQEKFPNRLAILPTTSSQGRAHLGSSP